MASFKQLQKKAKQYGLTLGRSGGYSHLSGLLGRNGGYYYLSGLVHGKHTQGMFTNLKLVEKELSEGWKFDKVPDIRTITYASKKYEVKIEHTHSPPYGMLYINNHFMSSVFPSITRTAIIQYIQQYRRLK